VLASLPVSELIRETSQGLYCEAGGFHIDPWQPVERALVTHAHADHARPGCGAYLTAASGRAILAQRVRRAGTIEVIPYGEPRGIGGVTVSFHPAGHILGSAQIRLEHRGEVWVVSGDYKTGSDLAAEPFEAVPCHTFITESTFGLPVFRWPCPREVVADIAHWWRENRRAGRTSVVFAYALGKAQRVLAGLREALPEAGTAEWPVGVHGAVAPFLPLYAEAGVALPHADKATALWSKAHKGRGLVVAPGSVQNTPWLNRLRPSSLAFASGWMMVRGSRRRRALDRGFVLSDHCDWPGLIAAVKATGAHRLGVTHGQAAVFARYAQEELGLDAFTLSTRYTGESIEQEGPHEEAQTIEAGEGVE